jgi:hypothetical protein
LNYGHQGLGSNQLGNSSLSDRFGFRNTMDSYYGELRIQVIGSFQRSALLPAIIATLDKDFNIYRRYQTQPFDQAFLPQ